MKSFAKRFEKVLRPMQYLVIACGYVLLATIVWLLGQTLYIYITTPAIVEVIKAPPIAPLIPYFPKLFGLESFFPPLYFTYFLVALAVVVIVHEGAHGIFAKLNKIRIKTTGIAFLGPILGAFVEQDEKDMTRAKKFPQMAVLAAGTFANIVFAILFGLLLWIFFTASFVPAGVNFNLAHAVVDIDSIEKIDGIEIESLKDVLEIVENEEDMITLQADGKGYLAYGSALKNLAERERLEGIEKILVFEDAPATRAELEGPLLAIDENPVRDREELFEVMQNYNPGDEIIVKTKSNEKIKTQKLVLEDREGRAYLGIGFPDYPSGIRGMYSNFILNARNAGETYYEGRDFAWFIYYLLWWLVLINVLVALFNMLPLGILDGGRFFYLTIWGITGSEKVGRKAFALATWLIVMIFVLLILSWLIALF